MVSPLIGYLLIGLILKTNLVYVSKIFTIISMILVLFIARKFLFTSNFTFDFPLAVYVSTKVRSQTFDVTPLYSIVSNVFYNFSFGYTLPGFCG